MDIFSESRIGLRKHDFSKNLISVCTKNNTIKDVVGLVQFLPPKSLDRNTIAGLAQLVYRGEEKYLYVNLLHGLATYVARRGTFDALLDIPIKNSNNFKNFVKYKSKEDVYENLKLSIMRYGLRLAEKKHSLIGLDSPIKLPFNIERDRTKKEYELTSKDLSKKASELVGENLFAKLLTFAKTNSKDCISIYSVKQNFLNATLNDLLILLGIYYLFNHSCENDTTKFTIKHFQENNFNILKEETLELIASTLLELGEYILESHLISFSVVLDETNNFKERMIIWDLPLDKKINVSKTKPPENLYWISNVNNLDDSKLASSDIGINLEILKSINEDLLLLLEKLKKYSNIKNVYIKYALLSHLATLIREQNYNVISVI